MKNMWKAITNFFNSIWHFIDSKLVMPITKLIIRFTGNFDQSGKKFENWLSKSNTLLFISLILALATFIVIDQKILIFSNSTAEVLKRQPVTAQYNEEAYVVEGLPETVDITLIGSKTDLYIAKQSPSYNVSVDLTGLKPGTHRVNIKYNQSSSSIAYEVNPSVATVVIYPKISETKNVNIDLLNQESLNKKLTMKNVTLSKNSAIIKGAEYKLKKVATVKALVDLNTIPKQEAGTFTLKDVTLKAYDEKGEVVDVEIVPSKVDATIEIGSYSKEIPINVIPTGDVSFGQAISTITTSETKVTVYGTEEALSNINYVPVEIDVSGLKENQQYKMELNKPAGVTDMSVNNITINVTLDTVADRDIANVEVRSRNLAPGYSPIGSSAEDARITVNVKGVKSVIDQIRAEDIAVYVDLTGYTEGEHEVEVQVEGTDNRVKYLAKTKKVKITIKKD